MRRREGESRRVDIEVRDRAANADEERKRNARLANRLVRGVEGLVGLELLGLDAGQVPLVDCAALVASLKELERLLVGVDDLLGEPVRSTACAICTYALLT